VARVSGLVLAEHALVLLIVAAYIGATYAVLGRRTHVFWFGRSELWPFAISVLAVAALAVLRVVWADRRAFHGRAAARRAWRRRPATIRMWRWARRFYFRPERVLGALLFLLMLVPFMSAFTSWKRAIPTFRPFTFDGPFTAAARAMNGGLLEWQWLQPALGHPLVTLAIDRIYVGWYAVVTIFTVWQAWSPRRDLRSRYLLALVLCWILLGTGVAALWPAAGPVYYGLVHGGPDPYAPLMSYLHGVDARYHLWALELQDLLRNGYLHPEHARMYEGIAAMPSLHVALPVLFTIVAWRTHRLLGAGFLVFALLIFLGSIHLGWHYALDGYVSMIGVLGIWALTGIRLRKNPGAERA
jgi:hypothetical protein